MLLKDLLPLFEHQLLAGEENLEQEVTGGYTADLLSNVMANALRGNVWVTMQGHQNIIAVSVLLGLAAIIVSGGTRVDEETIRKAEEEKIPLLKTQLSTFEVVGRLYQAGVKEEENV